MSKYQVFIQDRAYTSWTIQDETTNIQLNDEERPLINPAQDKMFTKDVFTMNAENKVEIIYSPLKAMTEIPGVLVLESNKTYGRTENKKRLLYKCIPDDKHLPPFLIPYEVQLGFSKVTKNKYVIFKFDSWKDKHPHGILVQTLGNIDNLEIFYEYQLYCRSLHISISKFINNARERIEKRPNEEHISHIFRHPDFKIEDRRTKHYVFTIDPEGSLDFDDGFSIQKIHGGQHRVSVYIANVYFWLETFGLWKSFSKRVSTIYLPDRRRPMLPTILSESLCSLQKQQDRFAFAMDVVIDSNGKIVPNTISFKNVLINVEKNYVYEDHKMVTSDKHYRKLFDVSYMMDTSIKNSHDVVAHWMVMMNSLCGDYMAVNKFGIFRSSAFFNKNRPDIIDETICEDTRRVIRLWNNASGQYMIYNGEHDHSHEVMNLKSYIHITSPIRRLIDLLNQMLMFDKLGLVKQVSKDAREFLSSWMDQIEYINTSMRSIRKIQTDCELVHRCFTDPEIMKREHTGVIFDKILINNNMYSYMVYLEDIKLLSRITCRDDLSNYTKMMFKTYLFEDEDKIKKKIRLHIVTDV